MNSPNKIISFLGVMLFLSVNSLTLKNGHNWGDDFSQYIVHAQNIAEGRPYTQGLILNAWEIPPPGFPLLLAPLVKFFGINFQILKFWNIPGWLISAYFLFLIAKRRLKETDAVLVFVFLLSSPFFFFFKQSALSDIPFLAFLAPALFAWTRYFEDAQAGPNQHRRRFFGALGLTTFAFMIRYGPGAILFLSLILYSLFVRKEKKPALVIGIVWLATLWLLTLLGSNLILHAQEIPLSFLTTLKQFFERASYSCSSLVTILTPDVSLSSFSAPGLFMRLTNILAFPLLLAAYGIFAVKAIKGRTVFVEWFFLLYLLAVSFWDISDGVRYLLPISGLAVIFIIESYYHIAEKMPLLKIKACSRLKNSLVGISLCLLLFFNTASIVQNFSFNDDEILKPETTELVRQMKAVMGEDDVFTAVRARALSLLSGRQGVKLRYPFDATVRYFQVKYFVKLKPRWVAGKGWDEESTEEVYAPAFDFLPVWENDYYIIFKLAEKRQVTSRP